MPVEPMQKRRPVVEPFDRQAAGKIELIKVKISCTGVRVYLKRIMCRAKEARDLSRELDYVVHHMRQCNEFGEATLLR